MQETYSSLPFGPLSYLLSTQVEHLKARLLGSTVSQGGQINMKIHIVVFEDLWEDSSNPVLAFTDEDAADLYCEEKNTYSPGDIRDGYYSFVDIELVGIEAWSAL
jgi:hypothetical protein